MHSSCVTNLLFGNSEKSALFTVLIQTHLIAIWVAVGQVHCGNKMLGLRTRDVANKNQARPDHTSSDEIMALIT
jgi:hypothetical protein